MHGAEPRRVAVDALDHDEEHRRRDPYREEEPDPSRRHERVPERRGGLEAGLSGRERDARRGQRGPGEDAEAGHPAGLDRRLEPQLPRPRAVALEAPELGPGVAAQAARGEEHEADQEGRGAAADEQEPARGDLSRAVRRLERGVGGAQPERPAGPLERLRCGALATQERRHLPVVEVLRVDRGRPPVPPEDRREDRERRELLDVPRDEDRRRGRLAVGRRAQAGEIERERAGHATDDDEPHAVLGHDRDVVAAGLDDLAPARRAHPGQPARRQVQPPAGIVDRPERHELAVQVELGVGDGARGLAGLDAGEGVWWRPVDLAVAAGRRGAEPRRRDAPVGRWEGVEAAVQLEVGGDHPAAGDARCRGRCQRDAGRHQDAAPGPGPDARPGDAKRRADRADAGR